MVYVADTMEKARQEFRDPVLWYYKTISNRVVGKGVLIWEQRLREAADWRDEPESPPVSRKR